MSYCRWSSDDFRCDLYVYGSGDDVITIHVASGRHVPVEPLPPLEYGTDNMDIDAWIKRSVIVSDIIRRSETKPIGLPCDGESYDLPYLEAAAKVRELIAMGYQCDPKVADALESDAPP